MAFKTDLTLEKEINNQQEDEWTNHTEGTLDVKSLTHTFGNNKALFEIIDNNILFYANKYVSPYVYTMPPNTPDLFPKNFVDNVISKFEHEKSPNNWEMDKYMKSFVDKLNLSHQEENKKELPFEQQIKLAEKTGYIQGVCECVAALGDDYTLGKKLLTEMNVDINMAKKYSNPETFKKLEHGIFAQTQEQKLEQTQGIKL